MHCMVLVVGSLVAERMLAVADRCASIGAATNKSDIPSQREVDFANSTLFYGPLGGVAGSVASATCRREVSYREQLTF
jgi:hypothetical protein